METFFVQVFSSFLSTIKNKKHDISTDNNVFIVRSDRPLRPYRDEHIPRPIYPYRLPRLADPISYRLASNITRSPRWLIYTLGNRIAHESFCFTIPTEPFFFSMCSRVPRPDVLNV